MHLDVERYYIDHAHSYFARTKSLDSSFFLRPFVDRLATHDPVLDLGCGSGRDLLWLKTMGFLPVGVEQSPELARLAREYSGCPVICGDFSTLDFSELSVSGLLFTASLVHLPHEQAEDAIHNPLSALLPGGLVYVSLKKGNGTAVDDKHRTFYLWEDGDARMLFDVLGLKLLDFQETPAADLSDDIWLSYCLRYEKMAGRKPESLVTS